MFSKNILRSFIILPVIVLVTACQLAPSKSDEGVASTADLSPETVQKYGYALQLMKKGNDDAAIKVFDGVTRLNSALSGPFVNRGLIYLKQGDKEKAEESFRDAIKRNPSNVAALNQLGVLLREQKDFKGAREQYEAALAIDENHGATNLNLGILCDIYLQDKQCAMTHYLTYLQLNEDDEQVNNWVVDLKEQL